MPPLLLLIALAAAPAAPAPAAAPRFTLDGRDGLVDVISLEGTPEKPREGDVLRVGKHTLRLGPDRRVEVTATEDGRLLVGERVIAARISFAYKDNDRVKVNPLAKLTDAELKEVRGVLVDDWDDQVAALLQKLDPARVCITLTQYAGGEQRAMPELPPKLECLRIYESSSEGMSFAALAHLPNLRYLAIHTLSADKLDVSLFKGAKDLRVLELSGQNLDHAADLALLTQLRTLDLGWTQGAEDLSFAKSLARLRTLNLSHTGAADLTPLSGLAELTSIDADASALKVLPKGGLKALKTLRAMSAKVAIEDARSFAKAHPACHLAYRWDSELRSAVAKADRLRVRSGGTCLRSPRDEKTLVEIRIPEVIKELVSKVWIDEEKSGFHCMCCGSPTLEFYEGDQVVAMVGVHHGRSLRWIDGWPADALLTDPSAEYLNHFLAERGVTGPLDERAREEIAAKAARRRNDRYHQLLPDQVREPLEQAKSEEEAVAAFGKLEPGPRLQLAFKLYGCDDAAWNQQAGLDKLVAEKLLEPTDKEALAQAMKQAVTDPSAINGVARWLFGSFKHADVAAPLLSELLPKIGPGALAHPQAINRRRTIASLEKIGGPAAIALLRAALSGAVQPRPLAPEDAASLGGWVEFRAEDSEVEEGCSDRAYAALALGKLGDKASLPAVEALTKAASPTDLKVLAEARKLLTGK
jgi:hypothetical protein